MLSWRFKSKTGLHRIRRRKIALTLDVENAVPGAADAAANPGDSTRRLGPHGRVRSAPPERFLWMKGGPNNVTRLGIAGRVLPMTVVICALGTGCGSPAAPTPTKTSDEAQL